MKNNYSISAVLILMLISSSVIGQIELPINFENDQITNEDIIHFNGGSGYVVYNPQIDDDNPSDWAGVVIRDGGDIWAGTYIELDGYIDFSTNTTLNMNVLSPYPGLMVKFKIEGNISKIHLKNFEFAKESKKYVVTPQREILKKQYKVILDIINNGFLVKNNLINYNDFKKEYYSYVKQRNLGNSFFVWKVLNLELFMGKY